LNLSNNKIGPDDLLLISSSMKSRNHLKSLDLSCNNLIGLISRRGQIAGTPMLIGVKSFLEELANNNTMLECNLSHNCLGGISQSDVEYQNCEFESVGNTVAHLISLFILQNRSLCFLNLVGNNFRVSEDSKLTANLEIISSDVRINPRSLATDGPKSQKSHIQSRETPRMNSNFDGDGIQELLTAFGSSSTLLSLGPSSSLNSVPECFAPAAFYACAESFNATDSTLRCDTGCGSFDGRSSFSREADDYRETSRDLSICGLTVFDVVAIGIELQKLFLSNNSPDSAAIPLSVSPFTSASATWSPSHPASTGPSYSSYVNPSPSSLTRNSLCSNWSRFVTSIDLSQNPLLGDQGLFELRETLTTLSGSLTTVAPLRRLVLRDLGTVLYCTVPLFYTG